MEIGIAVPRHAVVGVRQKELQRNRSLAVRNCLRWSVCKHSLVRGCALPFIEGESRMER